MLCTGFQACISCDKGLWQNKSTTAEVVSTYCFSYHFCPASVAGTATWQVPSASVHYIQFSAVPLVGQQIWESGGVHEYLIKCLEDETDMVSLERPVSQTAVR